jgi:hypothetical protein
MRAVLAGVEQAQPVRMSQLRAVTWRSTGSRLSHAARVLADLDLLVVDAVAPDARLVERSCVDMPAGFRDDVQAWLTEGGAGSWPRSAGADRAGAGTTRSTEPLPDPADAAGTVLRCSLRP